MFSIDEDVLAGIGKGLLKNGHTIAVAESVTTGFIQMALGSIKDAMKFYQGGITTYNIAQKFRHLAVEPINAERTNAVSAGVAAEMSLGVSALFCSHWGIGITGFASPVPESGNKLYAYYAISFNRKIVSDRVIRPQKQSPPDIQAFYVNLVLSELLKQINSPRFRKIKG